MSGLMDKAKDAVGKVSGGSSGSSESSSGGESGVEKYTHQGLLPFLSGTTLRSQLTYFGSGVDMATDKVGMGDKYDSKIDEYADKEVKNYTSGSSGSKTTE